MSGNGSYKPHQSLGGKAGPDASPEDVERALGLLERPGQPRFELWEAAQHGKKIADLSLPQALYGLSRAVKTAEPLALPLYQLRSKGVEPLAVEPPARETRARARRPGALEADPPQASLPDP